MFWDSKIRAIARRLRHHLNTPLRTGYLSLALFGVLFILAIVMGAITGLKTMWLCAVGHGAFVGFSLLVIK